MKVPNLKYDPWCHQQSHPKHPRRNLPFVVGVIGAFAENVDFARLCDDGRLTFTEVNKDSLSGLMESWAPTLRFSLERGNEDPLLVELSFRSFDDFEPMAIISSVPELRSLIDVRENVMAGSEGSYETAMTIDGMPGGLSIEAVVRHLDRLLSSRLSQIMHSQPFRRLEATWRSLKFLVDATPTAGKGAEDKQRPRLLIKAINCSPSVLLEYLCRWVDGKSDAFDALCTAIEEPLSCVIADYYFDDRVESDIRLLERIAEISDAVSVPFVAGGAPDFAGARESLEDAESQIWGQLKRRQHLEHSRKAWRSFRERSDARYVYLASPRFLARPPYAPDSEDLKQFSFCESGESPTDLCWGNAAFLVGQRICQAVERHNWPARLYFNGDSPSANPSGNDGTNGDWRVRDVTFEKNLSNAEASLLAEEGICPVVKGRQDEGGFALFTVGSCQRIEQFVDAEDTENNRRAASLEHLLCGARFAHGLALVALDFLINCPNSEFQLVKVLDGWLADYCIDRLENHSIEELASRPLLRIGPQVEVAHRPENRDRLDVSLQIVPHFQLKPTPLCFVFSVPADGYSWHRI